jgi:hypothetical protein
MAVAAGEGRRPEACERNRRQGIGIDHCNNFHKNGCGLPTRHPHQGSLGSLDPFDPQERS